MNEDNLIEMLLEDDIRTIRQWVITGMTADLREFLMFNMGYDKLDYFQLLEIAEGRELVEPEEDDAL